MARQLSSRVAVHNLILLTLHLSVTIIPSTANEFLITLARHKLHKQHALLHQVSQHMFTTSTSCQSALDSYPIARPACVAACPGCPPGFGANPMRRGDLDPLCAQCPPGTYYPGGNVEPCWRCRGSAFLTSLPGSASIVQCVCRPGEGPGYCSRFAAQHSKTATSCL